LFQANTSHHSLLTIAAELRLRIYDYLLPLDVDRGDLHGLVLSCRTIKDEVYYEMQKLTQKARDQLQARWPFDVRFEIPFPARLFRTGELVIEVPYLPSKLLRDLSGGDEAVESFQEDFTKRGGFSLGAQYVLLHVTQVEGTPSMEAEAAAYILGYVETPTNYYADDELSYIRNGIRLYMSVSEETLVPELIGGPETIDVGLKYRSYSTTDESSDVRIYCGRRGTSSGSKSWLITPHPFGST
jgi:hypothetical protein